MDVKRSRANSVYEIQHKLNATSDRGERSHSVSASQFQEWFDILVKDDVESADILMKTTPDEGKSILLNCAFNFTSESLGFGVVEKNNEKVNLPLHVAVGCASKKVTELMLQHDVDVLSTNEDGNNVLHSAVVSAFNLPKFEKKICKAVAWFLEQLNKDYTLTLLFQENKDGLRPIELAAQQGCLILMKTFFETKGHVSREDTLGLGVYRMHDVTEYELGERHSVSPIVMLAFLEEKKLNDDVTSEIILSPCILGWIRSKIKCNTPLLVAWCLLRILFIGAYILLDLDIGWLERMHGNKSSTIICRDLSHVNMGITGNVLLTVFLIMYIVCTFIIYSIEIYELWKTRVYFKRAYNFKGRKKIVANTLFFRIEQALLVLITFIACIQSLSILVTHAQLNYLKFLLRDVTRSFIPVLYLWSICYFFQLSASLGPSIISIQGMLDDMGQFMLLFFMMMLPFVHVFESFALGNSETGCIADFQNPYITSYTLFRMMLNIYDPSGLQMRNRWILYVLHVFYIFMVGILLINFLIAMMSHRASQIAEDENVTLRLNQLAMVVVLEDRIYAIPSFGQWVYKRLRKRAFHCEGGKIYHKSVASRFLQLNKERKGGDLTDKL